MPAEDLCEIKSLSDSIMREGENQKFPLLDEALLPIDGSWGRRSHFSLRDGSVVRFPTFIEVALTGLT